MEGNTNAGAAGQVAPVDTGGGAAVPVPVSSSGYYQDYTLRDARDLLYSLHKDFPFADWEEQPDEHGIRKSRSLAVQIAAMLSQFADCCVRRGSNRMGFVYNANCQRSGKTLLAEIAIIPVYGEMKTQSWNSKDEELRKVLDAEAIASSTYAVFDNVRGYVQSPTLEAFMTSAMWTGRVLGSTKMFNVNNNVTVFITGNEVSLSSDLCHRCLFCELFVPEADTQSRPRPEMVIDSAWLKQKTPRREILSAMWNIVRHWDAAGRPKASDYGLKPRAGFEAWCEVIGGMVYFAGFGDCLAVPEMASGGDSEWDEIKKLVMKLADAAEGKSAEFTFQEIVNVCVEEEIFEYKLDGPKRLTDEAGDVYYQLNASAKTHFSRFLAKWAPRKQARVFTSLKLSFRTVGDGHQKRFVIKKLD